MEEKNVGKEVKMQAVSNHSQKLSYEELNQTCAEMSQQIQQQNKHIQQLYKQIQEMSFLLQNKRLDYLFRIVEFSKTEGWYKFDRDFVTTCIDEIQSSLTLSHDEEKEETDKEN